MSAQERATQLLESTRSLSGDAWLTANYTDDGISRGFGHQVRRVLSIPNTGTYKIVFDTTAALGMGIFILPLVLVATGGPVVVQTYPISSYAGGTILPATPLNYINGIAAKSLIKHGITSSDTSTDLREYLLGSDGKQGDARAGTGGGSVPLIMPGGTIFCMEIDNNYSSAVQFVADLVWFELSFG